MTRHLAPQEINALQSQGNSAQDWGAVLVPQEGCDLSQVWHCHFAGQVTLGRNCSLRHVHWIENYELGDNVSLFNVGSIVYDGHIQPLEVMNECGGRAIWPVPGMTTAMAYLWARYRGRTRLMERLQAFERQPLNRIGEGCVLRNVLSLRNVYCDEDVVIQDCPSIENGVADRGCRIESGVIAHRFVLCENVHLEMGLRLNDTVVGSNSTLARGEVGNSLIFPAHEQHHNSSFLIASLIQGQSNIASGCTIGSNHNGRTPTGELQAGRGFWPGLCCSFKHSSRFASYTLLAKGDYPAELNITLPFSLVNNNVSQNQLEVMPAYWWMHNMYALQRNDTKFAARDQRMRKAQHIEYSVLAPDTVEEIILARALLREWTAEAYRQGNLSRVVGHGMENAKRPTLILKAAKAYEAYEEMLIHYALSLDPLPCEGDRQREWVNLGGQLATKADIEQIITDIEQGSIASWQALQERLDQLWQAYPEQKRRHAYQVLCLLAGARQLTAEHWQMFRSRHAQILQSIEKRKVANLQKDSTNPFRQMTYLDPSEQQAVLG